MFKAKNKIILMKKILKFVFTGFSIIFIGVLFFITVHDLMTANLPLLQSIVQSMAF
jgi:hypothetical protein